MAADRMTLRDIRRHVGQLAFAGFAGLELPAELKGLAREFDLGGIILFARNVEAPEQVAELARAAQSLAGELPLWVSVDQEGGRVARLRSPFTEWPPMIALGRSNDEGLARRFAMALAAELAAVGITLDFAPVLDINTNPSNPVIGDRAIAERADVVARLGRRIIETLQAQGIAACGKHFPGHGDTSADSHKELPFVEHSPDRLRAVELVPFRAAIEAGVAGLMTAHVIVASIDPDRPATLSRRLVHDLLRRELGFGGVIFTDDLDMQAIAAHHSPEAAAVGALVAGCDALLMCGPDVEKHARMLEAVIHAVEDEALSLRGIEDAFARHRRMKERFLAGTRPVVPPAGPELRAALGRDEHRAVADEMARYL
jgi:beta-N-acetylhexosaminidase